MKRSIHAGKNFSVNTKKDENANIIEWLNLQSNLSDSIRFLIEQEILLNGIRNLQQVIPANRGYEYSPGRLSSSNNLTPNETSSEEVITETRENVKKVPADDVIDSWV